MQSTHSNLQGASLTFCREFETVAGELERMSAGSNGRMTAPSANHIRLQLDGMLAQRSSAEAFQAEVSRHHQTQSLLDEESSRLRCAKSEVSILQASCLWSSAALSLWLSCNPAVTSFAAVRCCSML